MLTDSTEKIITETYNKYRKPFLGFAFKNYRLSGDITEDIYQDTMIAFHQNLVTGKINNLEVPSQTYVFTIGKNKIVDYFRKSGKEVEIEKFPDIFSSDNDRFSDFYEQENDENEKRNLIVYNTVSQMENPCKKVLSLFFWDKKSMSDIAKEMKFNSPEVAKTTKSRCMKKIKSFLSEKLKQAELM